MLTIISFKIDYNVPLSSGDLLALEEVVFAPDLYNVLFCYSNLGELKDKQY